MTRAPRPSIRSWRRSSRTTDAGRPRPALPSVRGVVCAVARWRCVRMRAFAAVAVVTALNAGVAQAQFRAYVTNLGSDDVSVIDTYTNTVLTTIPVGTNPAGVAVTPDGAFAYVANRGSGTVSVIDTTFDAEVTAIDVGPGPQGIAITPDGAFAYVTHPALGMVSVIETAGNTLVTSIEVAGAPAMIGITPDGAFAYVGQRGNRVTAISLATNEVVATVNIGRWFISGLESLTISPDGAFVYVTNNFWQSVEIIDTSTNAVVGFLGSGRGGSGLPGYRGTPAVSSDGRSFYQPNFYSSPAAIDVLSTSPGTLAQTIPLPRQPDLVALTPDGAFAYVIATNIGSVNGMVMVADTTTKAVIGTIAVGRTPVAIAFSPRVPGAGAFGGTPRAVPGRVEAEDYDVGGQGRGYLDTTAGNEQGYDVYRADDVDITTSGEGGYLVGWLAAGEWLNYTMAVPTAGLYTIQVRVGTPLPGRTFHIEVDEVDVSGPLTVPETADWDQYGTVSIADIPMRAGTQVLRIVMGPEDFMDFQWLAIARQANDAEPGPFGGAPRLVPGGIEAEDYDAGGQGIGFVDTTSGNEQGVHVYRTDDVDIKASSEGGYAVGWLAAGEWLAYTISVRADTVYTIEARVGSPLPDRTFHIEIDGVDVTGPLRVPQVADWDQYGLVRRFNVRLRAGVQQLRVVMGPEDFMDFQWLTIMP
jgi:YVTN family beta-propeller protein